MRATLKNYRQSPRKVRLIADLVRGKSVDQALNALRSGLSIEAFANQNGYTWQVELAASRRSGMVPQDVLQRAFQLAVGKDGQSSFDYVINPSGDVQVLELARVTPGALTALDSAQRTRLRQQITAEFSRTVYAEYQRALRDEADITVL